MCPMQIPPSDLRREGPRLLRDRRSRENERDGRLCAMHPDMSSPHLITSRIAGTCSSALRCPVVPDPRVAKEGEILLCARSSFRSGGNFGHLVELVCWEVRGIGDTPQVGNKGGVNVSDRGPVYPIKELRVSCHYTGLSP